MKKNVVRESYRQIVILKCWDKFGFIILLFKVNFSLRNIDLLRSFIEFVVIVLYWYCLMLYGCGYR